MATEVAFPRGGEGELAPRGTGLRRISPYYTEGRYAEAGAFDLGTLLRILREWRWLILGAVALGLAGAVIVTLLTTPLYRARVTLEVNPPSVEILTEGERERAAAPDVWTTIKTQVGLLSSRSLAERTAQDLNLAARQEFVGDEGDAATRL